MQENDKNRKPDTDPVDNLSGEHDKPMVEETTGPVTTTGSGGILGWIEKMGNKLPHPFWIFLWICIFIVLLSGITAFLGVSAVDPGTGRLVQAQNLISGDGLRRFRRGDGE
jgi:p-aminobenzoyl-glutamate transporter AbgT